MALQVWPVTVGWLMMLPIEVVRARRESRVLRAAFGEQYEQYRGKTWSAAVFRRFRRMQW